MAMTHLDVQLLVIAGAVLLWCIVIVAYAFAAERAQFQRAQRRISAAYAVIFAKLATPARY